MYIRGVDKRVFKDFKEDYLLYLLEKYPGKLVQQKIYDIIKETKKELNIKVLINLNIHYWTVRGWTKEEAKEKVKEEKNRRKKPKYRSFQKEFWINKGFSEKDAINKVKNIQQKNSKKFHEKRKKNPGQYNQSSPMTIEFWIKKGFSKKEAISKINSQRKLNKEYWIKRGFTEKESIIKISEFQKENKEKYNKRKKENPEKYKDILPTQLGYWLKKTKNNINEAKKLLKEHQTTFSLEICVEKYGEIEGLRIWEKRQQLWKDKVFNKDTYIGRGTSILSNNIINNIKKYIKDELLYAENEKFIYDSKYKRAYKYDLVKPNNKKIIEINGIFWHCKPTLYESSYVHPVRNKTAEEIWAYDKRKKYIANQYGYDVLVIWEDEWYNNKDLVLNRCLNFFKNE
jgi:G:T-mismatch repair DNA endonuclease (very short patch repair protein)